MRVRFLPAGPNINSIKEEWSSGLWHLFAKQKGDVKLPRRFESSLFRQLFMIETFDGTSDKIFTVTFIPGGYGHFFYNLMQVHLKDVVQRVPNIKVQFSELGDSHNAYHSVMPLYYGSWALKFKKDKNLGPFEYNYAILSSHAAQEIKDGKQIVVLVDIGPYELPMLIKRLFPNAGMVRMYTPSFLELLISKISLAHKTYAVQPLLIEFDPLYRDDCFIRRTELEAIFGAKDTYSDDEIIEGGARYLQLIRTKEVWLSKAWRNESPDVLNIPTRNFYSAEHVLKSLQKVAKFRNTEVLEENLSTAIDTFITKQRPYFKYINPKNWDDDWNSRILKRYAQKNGYEDFDLDFKLK